MSANTGHDPGNGEASGNSGQSYISHLDDAADKCTAQTAAGMIKPTCYKMSYTELQTTLNAQGFNICDATPGNSAFPGSLGLARTECEFGVELSDKTQGSTPSGFNASGGASSPLKFLYVTATATAQVRLINTATGSARRHRGGVVEHASVAESHPPLGPTTGFWRS